MSTLAPTTTTAAANVATVTFALVVSITIAAATTTTRTHMAHNAIGLYLCHSTNHHTAIATSQTGWSPAPQSARTPPGQTPRRSAGRDTSRRTSGGLMGQAVMRLVEGPA